MNLDYTIIAGFGTRDWSHYLHPLTIHYEGDQHPHHHPVAVAKVVASLHPDDQTAYLELAETLTQHQLALEQGVKEEEEVRELTESIKDLTDQMREFRVALPGETNRTQFKVHRSQFEEALRGLAERTKPAPEQTNENKKQYREMRKELHGIEKEFTRY